MLALLAAAALAAPPPTIGLALPVRYGDHPLPVVAATDTHVQVRVEVNTGAWVLVWLDRVDLKTRIARDLTVVIGEGSVTIASGHAFETLTTAADHRFVVVEDLGIRAEVWVPEDAIDEVYAPTRQPTAQSHGRVTGSAPREREILDGWRGVPFATIEPWVDTVADGHTAIRDGQVHRQFRNGGLSVTGWSVLWPPEQAQESPVQRINHLRPPRLRSLSIATRTGLCGRTPVHGPPRPTGGPPTVLAGTTLYDAHGAVIGEVTADQWWPLEEGDEQRITVSTYWGDVAARVAP